MNIITRIIIIVAIVVSITDWIIFIKLKDHPERLTVKFVILVIIVTVVPIAINIWYHLSRYEFKLKYRGVHDGHSLLSFIYPYCLKDYIFGTLLIYLRRTNINISQPFQWSDALIAP